MREYRYTFESEALARLFVERLKLYLGLEATREGASVAVTAPATHTPEVERLARGSYARWEKT